MRGAIMGFFVVYSSRRMEGFSVPGNMPMGDIVWTTSHQTAV
jgi:hypothetical protein